MVGYNPKREIKLSHTGYAVAGAISGAVSRAVSQPLDVLKIRFQLQVEPISSKSSSKYSGIRQAFKTILKEEGIKAFWKGHIPAQILSVTYGIAQYASFELLTLLTWRHLPEKFTNEYRPITHTVCGALAGCIATGFSLPIDVMRTRFVAQGNNKIYKSLALGLYSITKTEGYRGLYKGFTPAIVQIGPQMGLQFGFYALFVQIWDKTFSHIEGDLPGIAQSLICGSGAGVVSKIIIYPLDVLKKRLQIQGFEEGRRDFGVTREYSNFRHCCITMATEEGLRGFYKGLSPSLLKAAVVAGTNLCAYDQICKLFQHIL